MNYSVQIHSEDFGDSWNNFVSGNAQASIYHSSSWINLIRNTYNCKPLYFALYDKDKLCGGIPFFQKTKFLRKNKLLTSQYVDHCDILCDNNEQKQSVFTRIVSCVDNNEYENADLRLSDKLSHIPYTKTALNHILPLESGIDFLRKSFHACIRRSIKVSERKDLKLHEVDDLSELKTFFLLYTKTRKYHGLFSEPFLFFSNLWKELRPQKKITIFYATYENKPISTILLISYNGVMYYLYGGSDRNFIHTCPSHFLLWHSINFAFDTGHRIFDFGRTAPDNNGLIQFKRSWGTEENNIYYYDLKNTTQYNSTGLKNSNVVRGIIRKLPDKVNIFAGDIIYKLLK